MREVTKRSGLRAGHVAGGHGEHARRAQGTGDQPAGLGVMRGAQQGGRRTHHDLGGDGRTGEGDHPGVVSEDLVRDL